MNRLIFVLVLLVVARGVVAGELDLNSYQNYKEFSGVPENLKHMEKAVLSKSKPYPYYRVLSGSEVARIRKKYTDRVKERELREYKEWVAATQNVVIPWDEIPAKFRKHIECGG